MIHICRCVETRNSMSDRETEPTKRWHYKTNSRRVSAGRGAGFSLNQIEPPQADNNIMMGRRFRKNFVSAPVAHLIGFSARGRDELSRKFGRPDWLAIRPAMRISRADCPDTTRASHRGRPRQLRGLVPRSRRRLVAGDQCNCCQHEATLGDGRDASRK